VLLDKAGVPAGDKLRGKWIGSFVVVEAIDGYRAVFALAELDPAFNDRTIILADLRNGQPLDKKHGPFQVIAPGDKRPTRWVWGVKENSRCRQPRHEITGRPLHTHYGDFVPKQ
jgi:hypothetical protein